MEKHHDAHLKSVGFEPIRPWRSCYYHAELDLFLVVYVDDFKMSGKIEFMERGWELIRQGVEMDDPTELGRFLGCEHKLST